MEERDPFEPRRTARFISPDDRSIRFHLGRYWGTGTVAAWLLWNPSYANEDRDDRTIERVIALSRSFGHDGAEVVNLWPVVTPSPSELWALLKDGAHAGDVRAENLGTIEETAGRADARFVAFGAAAGRRDPRHVREALERFGPVDGLLCLARNTQGWPRHPSARGRYRVPDDCVPIAWEPPPPR